MAVPSVLSCGSPRMLLMIERPPSLLRGSSSMDVAVGRGSGAEQRVPVQALLTARTRLRVRKSEAGLPEGRV